MTTPTQNTEEFDPLASFDKIPAVSFDPGRGGVPENTWLEMDVNGFIKLVPAKDDNGRPKVYEDSGKPVMKSVLPVLVDGEERGLWAKKNWVEGGLFRGLADVQREAGRRLGPGVRIAVAWSWDTSKPKKLGNHPKKYAVKLVSVSEPPPATDPLAPPAPSSDPWSTPPPVRVQPVGDEPPF